MKEIEQGGGMLVEREKIHVKRQESASAWGDLDSGRDRILCGGGTGPGRKRCGLSGPI